MIIDNLTPDEIRYVIEDIKSVCACRDSCEGCNYAYNRFGIVRNDCALSGTPSQWKTDEIRKECILND